MKVSELTGAELDYWVAKAEGRNIRSGAKRLYVSSPGGFDTCMEDFSPSTLWFYGGPIIEREQITVECWQDTDGRSGMRDVFWSASIHGSMKNEGREGYEDGPTPLIAAMRAFVASKYGNEVADE